MVFQAPNGKWYKRHFIQPRPGDAIEARPMLIHGEFRDPQPGDLTGGELRAKDVVYLEEVESPWDPWGAIEVGIHPNVRRGMRELERQTKRHRPRLEIGPREGNEIHIPMFTRSFTFTPADLRTAIEEKK